MKKPLLLFLFLTYALAGKSTVHVVTTSGFTFTPASITILAGDTVDFTTIGSSHTVLEVDQTSWNANQANALPGGFMFGFGGGTLYTAGLSQGMHWYVCQPHAGLGMKGTINVQGTVGTAELTLESTALAVTPNPFSSQATIHAPGIDRIVVYNVLGRRVDEVAIDDRTGSTLTFNGEALSRGLYFFRFLHEGRVVETRAVVHE